ncbi:MAG: CDP-diacylglycerol--glycerol-3-phosphate 3-phosphatidyltransferase [Pseudomonadota bacterium]
MKNLPNILTFSRMAAIPLVVALFFVMQPWAYWVAAAIFALAAVTDFLDGYLARAQGTGSPLGKMMDPIADKMLVTITLILLVAFAAVPGWHLLAAIIILAREVLISGVREYLASVGATGLPVSKLAKWKTTTQLAALMLLIVVPAAPGVLPFGLAMLWLAAILTVITGWDYLQAGLKQIAGSQN